MILIVQVEHLKKAERRCDLEVLLLIAQDVRRRRISPALLVVRGPDQIPCISLVDKFRA